MRISDWSSDVGSSDLSRLWCPGPGPGWSAWPDGLARPAAGGAERGLYGFCLAAFRHGGPAGGADPSRENRTGPVYRAVADRNDNHAADAATTGIPDQWCRAGQARNGKAGVHTAW